MAFKENSTIGKESLTSRDNIFILKLIFGLKFFSLIHGKIFCNHINLKNKFLRFSKRITNTINRKFTLCISFSFLFINILGTTIFGTMNKLFSNNFLKIFQKIRSPIFYEVSFWVWICEDNIHDVVKNLYM